jgi:hypothetical protein
MGITFSKIGGAIKRAVSPKAREAYKAEQQRVQERMAQAREIVRARRAGENQEVTELINRVQDEVNLDQFTKLEKSLPSAPTHRPGTKAPNKKFTRAHSADKNQKVTKRISRVPDKTQDQFIKFPSVPMHRPGNTST